MPLIRFCCNNPECSNEITKFFNAVKDIATWLDCGECGTGKLERTMAAPSTKSTQVIDNGLQIRETEVMNAVVENESDRLYEDED